jgi:hypothetical protein
MSEGFCTSTPPRSLTHRFDRVTLHGGGLQCMVDPLSSHIRPRYLPQLVVDDSK